MILKYKKNKEDAISMCGRKAVNVMCPEKIKTPFESCGSCKYASHGFLCYISEGVCLRNNYKKQEDTNCEFSK